MNAQPDVDAWARAMFHRAQDHRAYVLPPEEGVLGYGITWRKRQDFGPLVRRVLGTTSAIPWPPIKTEIGYLVCWTAHTLKIPPAAPRNDAAIGRAIAAGAQHELALHGTVVFTGALQGGCVSGLSARMFDVIDTTMRDLLGAMGRLTATSWETAPDAPSVEDVRRVYGAE